jgi:hypothetical protein
VLFFFAYFPGKNWVGMNSFLEYWKQIAYRPLLEAVDRARYQKNLESNKKRIKKILGRADKRR